MLNFQHRLLRHGVVQNAQLAIGLQDALQLGQHGQLNRLRQGAEDEGSDDIVEIAVGGSWFLVRSISARGRDLAQLFSGALRRGAAYRG